VNARCECALGKYGLSCGSDRCLAFNFPSAGIPGGGGAAAARGSAAGGPAAGYNGGGAIDFFGAGAAVGMFDARPSPSSSCRWKMGGDTGGGTAGGNTGGGTAGGNTGGDTAGGDTEGGSAGGSGGGAGDWWWNGGFTEGSNTAGDSHSIGEHPSPRPGNGGGVREGSGGGEGGGGAGLHRTAAAPATTLLNLSGTLLNRSAPLLNRSPRLLNRSAALAAALLPPTVRQGPGMSSPLPPDVAADNMGGGAVTYVGAEQGVAGPGMAAVGVRVTWTRFALDPVGMRSQDMRDRDAASVSR
jgi:hypothetical protein